MLSADGKGLEKEILSVYGVVEKMYQAVYQCTGICQFQVSISLLW